MAENSLVVEVDPKYAFSPVKNAIGAASETPETARAAMMNVAREWLQHCGVSIAPDTAIEINPMFAVNAEELAKRIEPGTVIEEATYLN